MVLITGGSGYIGSAVAAYLRHTGTDVLTVDTKPRNNSQWPDIPHVVGDVGDPGFIGGIFERYPIDAVVHLAGLSIVPESMEFPRRYIQHNVLDTMGLLEAMRLHSVKSLVFSSSAAVYGDVSMVPIRETTPLHPTSAYGLSKVFCEQLLQWSSDAWGLRSISLRYFNAAGGIPEWGVCEKHHPETHLIPSLITRLRNREPFYLTGSDFSTPDGTAVRDFVHVMDIAIAHGKALAGLEAGVQGTFNIGSGTGHSVREVMSTVQALAGKTVDVEILARRPGDPPILVADIEAVADALGWTPQHSALDHIVATALASTEASTGAAGSL